mgnify:CR=1 FL=1
MIFGFVVIVRVNHITEFNNSKQGFRIHNGVLFGETNSVKKPIIICKKCGQSTKRLFYQKRAYGIKKHISVPIGYCEFCSEFTVEKLSTIIKVN